MQNHHPKKALNFTKQKEAGKAFSPNESALTAIISKANILIELNKKVSAHLPSNLRNVCQVANVDRSQLTILTANGTFATELRYQTQDLIRKFKSDPALSRFSSIHIIVRPRESNPSAAKRKIPRLSRESAAVIETIAAEIEDVTLKKALLNLSKNSVDN